MTEPLVVACVKWGERYGAYYVNMLYEMVRRHMPQRVPYVFHCFTDDPNGLQPEIMARKLPGDLTGWWNKLYLFKEGVFKTHQRIVYFDLDTLIIGPLENLVRYNGDFAILRDFYRPHGYGSGVMLWRAGACHSIWSSFKAAGSPDLPGGDQIWVETSYPKAALLQDCFPGMFASFKTDCRPLPPIGTSVVCFHGEPKQDNCDATWVREIWKPGGMDIINPAMAYPTVQEEQLAHARNAARLPHPWLERKPEHARVAVLIGSGATLDECKEEILLHDKQDHDFFAVNRSSLWLQKNNIPFDAHVMCDTEKERAAEMPQGNIKRYYASICHAAVFENARAPVILWHPEPVSGSTAGLQAIQLAHILGYRRFHLYGFDSCCHQGAHHACFAPGSNRERLFALDIYGRRFYTARWMPKQAEEFMVLADILLIQGCSITIHGDGLLRFLATQAQKQA